MRERREHRTHARTPATANPSTEAVVKYSMSSTTANPSATHAAYTTPSATPSTSLRRTAHTIPAALAASSTSGAEITIDAMSPPTTATTVLTTTATTTATVAPHSRACTRDDRRLGLDTVEPRDRRQHDRQRHQSGQHGQRRHERHHHDADQHDRRGSRRPGRSASAATEAGVWSAMPATPVMGDCSVNVVHA